MLIEQDTRESGDGQVQMPARLGPGAAARPPLSIIIPAFNEADRLAVSLPRMLGHPLWTDEVELLVVDDGSRDGTADVARRQLDGRVRTSVLQLPWHAGKGAAVRLGVAVARGQSIVFMDADLATDLHAVPSLLHALEHADVVIGSRARPGAVVTGRSVGRTLLHRGFGAHARRITGIAATDPQCGFKGFRADAAKLLFHLSRVDGFGFDVEVLYLAGKLGLEVAEVPVCWHAMDGSKVRPVRDSLSMLQDVALVRLRHRRRLREAG